MSRRPCPGVAGQKVRDDASADRPDATQRLHLSPGPATAHPAVADEGGRSDRFSGKVGGAQSVSGGARAADAEGALPSHGQGAQDASPPLAGREDHSDPPERRLAVPGGPGNALRSPARSGIPAPEEPVTQAQRRPAPGPAGTKRPPSAGRALVGGFGPRRTCGRRSAWPGRWPRPDRVRRAPAEKCPAFQPAVPAVGTRSTSC